MEHYLFTVDNVGGRMLRHSAGNGGDVLGKLLGGRY